MQYPWSRPGSSREPSQIPPSRRTEDPESAEEIFRRDYTEPMETHQQQQNVPKKNKRFRSAFTTDQVNFLEMEFQKFPYIGGNERKQVANILNIPERAIKIWFQNRRMREKKELVGNSESDESNRNINELGEEEVNSSTISMPPIINSLPELTVTPSVTHAAHIDLTNFEQNLGEATDSRDANYYNDLVAPLPEVSISRVPKPHSSKPAAENSSQLKYRSSAEFSIDLCKKYKKIGVTQLQSRTEDISLQSLQSVPVTLPRMPPSGRIPKIEHQSSPEDLSYNKSNANKIQIPSPSKKVSPTSSGLIPVYVNYPQPYLSAGNMLWKPVNVLPIMSTGFPPPPINLASVPPGPFPLSQDQSTVKKNCNCDCHVGASPPVPQPETSSSSEAQYVMTAFPFQKYPKF